MNIDFDSIWSRFQQIRVWVNRDRRAPHKPLLIIWAIGRCLNGLARLTTYEDTRRDFLQLFRRFGVPRRNPSAHYPFWRLQSDNVWEIDRPRRVRLTASGDASETDLLDHRILGGLIESDYNAIEGNPELGWRIALSLLDSHFPYSLHDDILLATGFYDIPVTDKDEFAISAVRRRKRDPAFRYTVLDAYCGRCAICGLSLESDNAPVAMEAAHIQWHAAGGPAEVRNGLALCSLHHSLFDIGAFTLLDEFQIAVSESIKGNMFQETLGRYHQREMLVLPCIERQRPDHKYVMWHRREVFRGNAV